MVAITDKSAGGPPVKRQGVLAWLRANLFSSPGDTLLTLAALALISSLLVPVIDWAVINATWSGESRADCASEGACWVFLKARIGQFIYGFYPEAARWRVNLTGLMLIGLIIWLAWPRLPGRFYAALFALSGFPLLAYWLLAGGFLGLDFVETTKWGGLVLTIVVALAGIVIAIFLGVLLALGRRSDLPAVRLLATGYIEFIRAVPLITILFMASVMLPLFLPEGVSLSKVLRAMIGTALFWSAYMAEAVRGGLQAVPRGQYEAAQSIGLGYWRSTLLIILPQAIKASLPAIMNTIISLVKDTTLLLLIGIFELLGIVQAAAADPQWLGNYVEGYVFVALVFFILCFGMSVYSRGLERKLEQGG